MSYCDVRWSDVSCFEEQGELVGDLDGGDGCWGWGWELAKTESSAVIFEPADVGVRETTDLAPFYCTS